MKKFKPGVTFGDFMVHDSAVTMSKVRPEKNVDLPRLSAWIWVGVMISLGVLLVKLVSLQIFEGGKYRILADENRILRIRVPAKRGTIYDRNGQILAQDKDGIREYKLGSAASHVLGYVGEVSPDEVGLIGESGGKYEAGSWIGRSGIEQEYEEELKGKDGGRLVEVDNKGQVVRELGSQAAVGGQDMTLTIDGQLQQTAFENLENKRGAVIISNPNTGEILALVSSPSFDPNTINAQYSILNTQSDLPFLNRAIGGVFVPGSVFKIATTVAALAEKKIDPGFTYNDMGSINVGSFSYTNWLYNQYGRTEGVVGWERAIARSTDTFFYKVGELTGPEMMAKWATILGLGVKTGIDLPGEVAGLIPTPEWKEKIKNEKWFLGNTYHMAIGQGDVLTTPLQVNVMTNVIAAGGSKCVPHINKVISFQCSVISIGENVLKIIKDGMVGACSTDGTAFPLFDFKPQVACKTGTAEYIRPDGKIGTHAWLTAFAPADNPIISVTVLVEGGGEGSRVAAPIVRKILAKYFGVEDKYNYAAVSGVGE